ncbi:basic salivary proline-rich protein 3-like [Penaeus chinensis]|uniref:basic salivary proline-rich protein 3-like n=1 Tax=Penaeus chinensis TaxID=139456 RepID=UPI001FB6534B|nr:basic salivary proline-rich protein 3-like [Penaeus chinensis]
MTEGFGKVQSGTVALVDSGIMSSGGADASTSSSDNKRATLSLSSFASARRSSLQGLRLIGALSCVVHLDLTLNTEEFMFSKIRPDQKGQACVPASPPPQSSPPHSAPPQSPPPQSPPPQSSPPHSAPPQSPPPQSPPPQSPPPHSAPPQSPPPQSSPPHSAPPQSPPPQSPPPQSPPPQSPPPQSSPPHSAPPQSPPPQSPPPQSPPPHSAPPQSPPPQSSPPHSAPPQSPPPQSPPPHSAHGIIKSHSYLLLYITDHISANTLHSGSLLASIDSILNNISPGALLFVIYGSPYLRGTQGYESEGWSLGRSVPQLLYLGSKKPLKRPQNRDNKGGWSSSEGPFCRPTLVLEDD